MTRVESRTNRYSKPATFIVATILVVGRANALSCAYEPLSLAIAYAARDQLERDAAKDRSSLAAVVDFMVSDLD